MVVVVVCNALDVGIAVLVEVVVEAAVELVVDDEEVVGEVPNVAAVVLVINFFNLRAIVVLCH